MPPRGCRDEQERSNSGQPTRSRTGDRHYRPESSRLGYRELAQVAVAEEHYAQGDPRDEPRGAGEDLSHQDIWFPHQGPETEQAFYSSTTMRSDSGLYGQHDPYSQHDGYSPYDHSSEYSQDVASDQPVLHPGSNDYGDDEPTPKASTKENTGTEVEGSTPMQGPPPPAAQQPRRNRSPAPPEPAQGTADPALAHSPHSYDDVLPETHDTAQDRGHDESWPLPSISGESSNYFDRAKDLPALMVQPANAPAPTFYYPMARSTETFISPVVPFAPLRNDVTMYIMNYGPLLVCIRDDCELSFINSRVSTQLRLETHPLPKAKQNTIITPLGTYEELQAYSVFFADINEFGVKNREFKMLNLAWEDNSLAQVIIGRKLLRKIQRDITGASRSGGERSSAIAHGASHNAPIPRQHGSSHRRTAMWAPPQPYEMSEGQSSQLQSPTQLSSTGVESGLFTAASVSSTLGSDFGESAAFTNPPFTFDETYDYDLGQNPQE